MLTSLPYVFLPLLKSGKNLEILFVIQCGREVLLYFTGPLSAVIKLGGGRGISSFSGRQQRCFPKECGYHPRWRPIRNTRVPRLFLLMELDHEGSLRSMVHSHSLQGLAFSLYLSGSFSIITHLLRPVPGNTHGDPGRLDWGKCRTACTDDLLNPVASDSSTRLLIRGCGLGHAGHSAALRWVSVCASSPLLSIQSFPVAV